MFAPPAILADMHALLPLNLRIASAKPGTAVSANLKEGLSLVISTSQGALYEPTPHTC